MDNFTYKSNIQRPIEFINHKIKEKNSILKTSICYNNLHYASKISKVIIPSTQFINVPFQIQKNIVPLIPQKQVITLYIGRLSEDFKDDFFQNLLMKCGKIMNWKRAKHSFGFVEFKEPEGALRCISIINGLRIKNNKILVTADMIMTKLLKNYEKGLKKKKFPLPKLPDILAGKEDDGKSIEHRLAARDAVCLLKIQQLLRDNELFPSVSFSSTPENEIFEKNINGSIRNFSDNRKEKKINGLYDISIKQNKKKQINIEKKERLPKSQKDLVSMIPRNEKDTLSFFIDWNIIKKSNLIEKKMRFWIDARLTEYLGGQEDKELTNFVVGLLKKEKNPEKIINEMIMILVEDTQSFVIKMWRRLIFEIMKVKFNLK